MSRVKTSLDHKRVRRLIWLVLTVFVLVGYSLQSVAGSVGYSMLMQTYTTVSSPPVILEEGNCSGTTTIYTNKTSAKVSVAAPFLLSGWSKRVRITIDHNDVGSTLSNFPISIYLSNSSGRNKGDVSCVFNEVGSNSKKIAVTTSDGTTQCYVEIDKWDATNKKAWLWVKVPSISSTSDTDLYLYYDSSHADNTAYVDDTNTGNSVNVWDSNFKMVQHMRDNTTSSIVDSTSNNNDGTKKGAGQPAVTTSGKIDDAQNFSGGDAAGGDYIDCGNNPSLQITGYLTVEAWVTIAGSSGEYLGIGGKLDTTNYNGYALVRHSDNKFKFWVGSGTLGSADSDITYTDSNWHYVVGVVNNGNNYIYVDGTKQVDEDTRTLADSGYWAHIGRQYYNYDRRYWEGLIDEFRISNVSRSTAWIKASYESGRDDLVAYGNEEVGASDYDHVLRVVNQVVDNWTINLQVYNSSNISRLSSLNISLHDGTSSNQIAVSDGSIVKSEGESYDLPGGVNSTIYISVSNLQATTTGTSYLYVHLKTLVPNSSTYILYVITFEIT